MGWYGDESGEAQVRVGDERGLDVEVVVKVGGGVDDGWVNGGLHHAEPELHVELARPHGLARNRRSRNGNAGQQNNNQAEDERSMHIRAVRGGTGRADVRQFGGEEQTQSARKKWWSFLFNFISLPPLGKKRSEKENTLFFMFQGPPAPPLPPQLEPRSAPRHC